MDKQKLFSQAYIGVVTQGQPSGRGICLYRDAEGNKCAIGHMIPDELYNPEFENTGDVFALVANYPKVKAYLGIKSYLDTAYLSQLQRAHDIPNTLHLNANYIDNFIDEMKFIASTYELTIPDLPQATNC